MTLTAKIEKLTPHQEDFLLNYFFKNESYPGWKDIALNLIRTGECIVAGTKCIWIGGIGNFIKTKKADSYIGCIRYVFNLDYFLTSKWYQETEKVYLTELAHKGRELEEEQRELEDKIEDLLILRRRLSSNPETVSK